MDKHQFKIIYSNEDDVYRILDLTDTSIVGVTEMYETDWNREGQVTLYNDIKTKKVIGAKVVGYGIFILLDEDNMPTKAPRDEEYLRSVLRQMAAFFKEKEIDESPDYFKDYYIPKPQRNTTVSDNRPVLKSPVVDIPQAISKPAEKKDKKKSNEINWALVIMYVGMGIAACFVLGIVGFLIWFIFFHLGGIIAWGVFILCAIAFIPELFR